LALLVTIPETSGEPLVRFCVDFSMKTPPVAFHDNPPLSDSENGPRLGGAAAL
jgi:hypothetical protein